MIASWVGFPQPVSQQPDGHGQVRERVLSFLGGLHVWVRGAQSCGQNPLQLGMHVAE